MRKLFNEEQIDFILKNYNNMKYSEIAHSLGGNITGTQISGWLSNNGYKKENKSIFTNEQKQYIKDNYKNLSYKNIAEKRGFNEKQIRNWIANNCESKIRTFNDSYFERIDNPTKAYFLGYIYADGWITISSSYEFGFELQKNDCYILEKLNDELGNVHDIKYAHKEHVILNNKCKSIVDTGRLRVYSKKLCDDLMSHNILPNKTMKPDYPIVQNDLFYDFLRGYIDGDGCITINKTKGYIQMHITSSHDEVFYYIKEKLDKENINSCIYKEQDNKYRLYINGRYALKLLEKIYKDENCIKLNRKYEKYISYKSSHPN